MNLLGNLFRDHLFRSASFAKPTALYISLHTENGVEVSGPGYQRAQLNPGDANWAADGDGEASNAQPVVFGEPEGDWGRIAGYALWDAPRGGRNLTGVRELQKKKNINDGDGAPHFQAGSLSFRFEFDLSTDG